MIRSATMRSAFLAGVACLALGGAAASPALADVASSKAAVDAAKAQGVVGEQADGFVGIVSGGDAALRAAVAELNAGRAAAYRDAAAKTGVTPDAAGQATARQLIARLPAGQYYKGDGGAWTKK
jgi:uncharacterized protein YdbL (DUF1318 family)